MEKIIVDLLQEGALDELRAMEQKHKIQIFPLEDLKTLKDKKQEMWDELNNYTYTSILKQIKDENL